MTGNESTGVRAVIGTSGEDLGRLVRKTWVEWARDQPDPKPSWLIGWDELDDGQREVDIRIGRAVAAVVYQRLQPELEKIERDSLARIEQLAASHPGGGAHVCSCGRRVQ